MNFPMIKSAWRALQTSSRPVKPKPEVREKATKSRFLVTVYDGPNRPHKTTVEAYTKSEARALAKTIAGSGPRRRLPHNVTLMKIS